jgi:glyoxylase-like metal-dependent hydrolase (beta-lactamase superfamily II)
MDESAHIDAGSGAGPDGTPDPNQVRWQLGEWEQLADGVYRLVAEPAAVNLGLVVGSEAALVVDTGSSPAQGAALRQAVARVTDRPIGAVVVSHAHFDHSFGLAGFAGISSIGHESLHDLGDNAEARQQAERLGFAADELVPPTHPIAIADAVGLGGQRVVEITHLGEGHTQGDLVITVTDPASADFPGVIFAGDLIESAPAVDRPAPWFGMDSAIDQWSWTVDRLRGLGDERTIFVPGHGDPVDQEFVHRQRDAIDAVRVEIARLYTEGVAEQEAAERGEWPFPVRNIAAGVAAGYAELRDATAQDPAAGDRRTLPLA